MGPSGTPLAGADRALKALTQIHSKISRSMRRRIAPSQQRSAYSVFERPRTERVEKIEKAEGNLEKAESENDESGDDYFE